MHSHTVRHATLADVPQIAEVLAKGFLDDDVFGRFMHPKRKEFPEDWLRYWRKEARWWIVQPSSITYIGEENTTKRIEAICVVKRIGDGAASVLAAEPYLRKGQRLLVYGQNLWEGQTWTDRTADLKAMADFEKNWEDICHHFTGSRKECWMIECLCVHPEVQRSGYGRDMIQSAIRLCQSEEPHLPLAVIASEIGDAFYEKQGFREVGRANVGDLSGVRGGSIKFYESHLPPSIAA